MDYAQKAFGTKLKKIKSGSEPEDILIGNVTSIGRIGLESEDIDVTDFDSPDGFREFVAGLKDAGSVPISGWIKNDENVEYLLGLADSQSMEEWEIEFPSGATWEFTGYVRLYEESELAVEGVRNYSVEIRISGKPTYTPAPASL